MRFSLHHARRPIVVGTALVSCLTASPMLAQTVATPQAAFAATGNGISYYSTPNRSHTTIHGKEDTRLANVTVALTRPADVLVQFTSQISTVEPGGCPCSLRATLTVDGGAPMVVKRVNLSGGTGDGSTYIPDRQPMDGSFVFPLPAGHHAIALSVQDIDGSAGSFQSFYANLQAIPFPR